MKNNSSHLSQKCEKYQKIPSLVLFIYSIYVILKLTTSEKNQGIGTNILAKVAKLSKSLCNMYNNPFPVKVVFNSLSGVQSVKV